MGKYLKIKIKYEVSLRQRKIPFVIIGVYCVCVCVFKGLKRYRRSTLAHNKELPKGFAELQKCLILKFSQVKFALVILTFSPATLGPSQAAEAGRSVLSLSDSWHTAGKDLSTSTGSPGHPK